MAPSVVRSLLRTHEIYLRYLRCLFVHEWLRLACIIHNEGLKVTGGV
ncbi:MAG: hypothetical protein BWZ02_02432 [Lentisphaerae bacterium ADurb.BinA184]|nr:MAG: hypothetical protein BWZ02_02432 [Lentisphaerae bacterium ADurb.BinA184]